VAESSLAGGQQLQQQQQEARDAVYWKHMYERLRDLRETEAERVCAVVAPVLQSVDRRMDGWMDGWMDGLLLDRSRLIVYVCTHMTQMLAEVTRHAEEREKALTDLVAHLEEVGGREEVGSSFFSSLDRSALGPVRPPPPL
jgi:hypothetical protein